jgi:hypothetical protein
MGRHYVRPAVIEVGNGGDELRWRERLGQKNAVGNATRTPGKNQSTMNVLFR